MKEIVFNDKAIEFFKGEQKKTLDDIAVTVVHKDTLKNKDKVINDLLKRISDLEFEVERLEKVVKVKDEGFKASTEDLCEESTKVEKLEKLNKKLWEENTRLSNGRELEQNAIDTLRDRIDKAIEYINNCSLPTTTNEYILSPNHLIDILKGVDKK